jgi:FixJ family two-component response regulator
MKAGAVDFLTKPLEEEALFAAVSAAVERDRDRREVIAAMRALQQRYATLTPREREVAHLVYTGLMNKQIAADLDISEVTVKLHRGSAMRKMAANSLAHFVRMIGALDSRVLSDELEGA